MSLGTVIFIIWLQPETDDKIVSLKKLYQQNDIWINKKTTLDKKFS